jgi:hypothetical protein
MLLCLKPDWAKFYTREKMNTIVLLLMTLAFGEVKPGTCQTQRVVNPDVMDIHLETKVADEMIRSEVTPPEKRPELMKKLLDIQSDKPNVAKVSAIWLKHKVVTLIKNSATTWEELLPAALAIIGKETKTTLSECSELPRITKLKDLP